MSTKIIGVNSLLPGHPGEMLLAVDAATLEIVAANRRVSGMLGCGYSTFPAITANVLPEDAERRNAAGMNGHLHKPLDRRSLAEAPDKPKNLG